MNSHGLMTAGLLLCLGAGGVPARQERAREAGEPGAGEEAGIYCRLSSKELRERVGELRAGFFAGVVAVDDLESGYRFWFERSSERLHDLADFVDFESECCPFLRFEISLQGEGELVALSLTGRDGTRELLEAMAESAAFDLPAALRAPRARTGGELP